MLTTVANYKAWAGIGATVSTYDDALASIIPQAEAMVAGVLDRKLETKGSDITEYYDGRNDAVLWLNAYPVVSITSVSYLSGVTAGVATFTAYGTTEYYYVADLGKLVRYNGFDYAFAESTQENLCWPEGHGNVKVVYQGGYTSSNVPYDLVQCIYEVTSAILHSRDGTRETPTQEALRGLIVDRVGDMGRQCP